MQAELLGHHQQDVCAYTFPQSSGAEQMPYNNVTLNPTEELTKNSQIYPFDAPFWRALPNCCGDGRVCQLILRNNEGHMQKVDFGVEGKENYDWHPLIINDPASLCKGTHNPQQVICR
ncbi:hypothetical protein O181_014827 [Austropuccinia psidii MF-1]|uniref:Uncharacterized protein n=1 Tax=Austropuccinia psidii MF-1 TaxID=1389203 RepID=A0A9Q3C2D9_9BASI|nr:hypothetical protein [Austropuccinia psidii MF-1]